MKRLCRSASDPPLPSLLPLRAPPPTAEFRRDPALWKLPVGLIANPDDTNWVPDSRVMPAGLKKIVEASSAAAASPANALPSPRALCSFTWKPAAPTLRASDTMHASTTSRQTILRRRRRLGRRDIVVPPWGGLGPGYPRVPLPCQTRQHSRSRCSASFGIVEVALVGPHAEEVDLVRFT